MKIILKSLELNSFKKLTGKWNFAEGKNVFLGENGTGKTTLCDAERWLRTGKDSQDSAKFDIKTIVGGEAMSKGSHSVKAVYDINGEELMLERIFAEKWTKTRGKMVAEKAGHTTTYSINGNAKTLKKHFEAKVEEVFGGESFLLASDLTYFAGLPWKRKREILSGMVGKIDREAIIDQIAGFSKLLDGLTVEEKADIAAQRKSDINKELTTLPARIDEHKRNIAQIADGATLPEAKKKVADCQEAINAAKNEIDDFAINESADTDKLISELNQKKRVAVSAFEEWKNDAQDEVNKRKARLRVMSVRLADNEKIISSTAAKIIDLKKDWTATREEKLDSKNGNHCLFCGEVITCGNCDEGVGDAKAAEKLFNKKKSEALAEIKDRGTLLVAKNKDIEAETTGIEKEKAELEAMAEPPILLLTENEEIAALKKEIDDANSSKPATETPQKLLDDLSDAKLAHQKAVEQLGIIRANKESDKRVKELEGKMASLSSEFDEIEKFLFMLDEYNKRLAEATENPVNDLFEYVRFRMFTEQVNGAIIPACDIMNDEFRPYETAMSAGEKMRAGLDITKTMSNHFQIFAPVFIDGSESITTMPALDCQTIELRVSSEHKELTQA